MLPSGIVLWPALGSRLLAVSPDGEVLWQVELGDLVTSPAVAADGTVAVGDAAGRVLLLRPTDEGPGTLWDVDLAESSYGPVVLAADGRTVYQSVVSGVAALRDGAVLWHSTTPSERGGIVEVSPAVAPDGTVVIGTNDSFQLGLDPEDGEDRNPGSIGIWASVAVDHTTYVGTRDGVVYAVSREGKLRWEVRAGTTVDSYPALAGDGALVIGTADGTLLSIAD